MKQALTVPPKSPNEGDTWVREDGVVFTWNKGWER